MSQEVNEAITLISQTKENLITMQSLYDTALVDDSLHKLEQALDKLSSNVLRES